MKNIKYIYRLLIVALVFIAYNTNAQQVNQNITPTYTGTWQYDTNNERFIVKIWQHNNFYRGHYKKVQLNNGVVGNTIYTSRIFNDVQYFYRDFSISTNISSEYGLTGYVDDNVASGTTYNPRSGYLQMKMTTIVPANGCNGCVVKASWKVTPTTGGLIVGGPPPPFSIPLDIELTKVSNTLTLD